MLDDVELGASIAVNGCCLTVVAWTSATAGGRPTWSTRPTTAPASAPSQPGDRVNLERPVRLADRLGGHLVQGHVDAVGAHRRRRRPTCAVRMPSPTSLRYVVEKGSITVDGISLTVVDASTTTASPSPSSRTPPRSPRSGRKGRGDPVNLEVDVIAKYVERLLAGHSPTATPH